MEFSGTQQTVESVSTRSAAVLRFAALALAIVSVSYHLWLIFQGLIHNLVSRPLHLALALPWLFFFVKTQSVASRISGWVLGFLGIAACLWVAINHNKLGDQYGILSGDLQLAIGILLIIVVLEGARRAIGWPLPLVALIA